MDIVITLLDQHIVPLGNGIVISEALAVFPVQLLDFSLFLFLTAGKVFQALCRIFYLETGFNHLGTPVTLYFYPFFRLFRRFLLRIAVFIPKDDKPRYYGGKPNVSVAIKAVAAALEIPNETASFVLAAVSSFFS